MGRTTSGRSGRINTKASLMMGGMPIACASTSVSWKWVSSRPAPSSRRATKPWRRGPTSRKSSAPSNAAAWSCSPALWSTRMRRSAASWTGWSSAGCARTRSSSTSWATTAPARRASRAPSASCSPRTTFPTPWTSSWPRSTSSAACPPSARPRPTTCITPAGPGPAARPSRAPSWWPRISAEPAIRSWCPGRSASSRTRPCARSSRTAWMWHPPSTIFSASHRRSW